MNPPVEEQRDPILMDILSAIQSLTARVRTLEGPGSNVDTSGEPQPEEAALPAGRNPGAIPVTAQGAEGGSGIHGTVPVPTTVVSEQVSDSGKFSASIEVVPDEQPPEDLPEVGDSQIKEIVAALPVFSGALSEYRDWSFQHRMVFIRAGLFSFISGDEPQPDRKTDPKGYSQWYDKNMRCTLILMRTVSESIR